MTAGSRKWRFKTEILLALSYCNKCICRRCFNFTLSKFRSFLLYLPLIFTIIWKDFVIEKQKNNQPAPSGNDVIEKIVSLSKRRGFVFQSSEIYGGLNGCWDYGPLGVELLKNIKEEWWKFMTYREDIEGIDASILMHPKVWEASGHVENFTDPMVDCKQCKARFRLDILGDSINEKKKKKFIEALQENIKNDPDLSTQFLSLSEKAEDLFTIS